MGRVRLKSAGGAIAEPPGRWRHVLVLPGIPTLRGEAGILGPNLTGPGRLVKSRPLGVSGTAIQIALTKWGRCPSSECRGQDPYADGTHAIKRGGGK